MAIHCRNWNALPDSGGVYDQEVGILKKMNAVISAYDTIKSRARAKNIIAWIDADPDRNNYHGYLKLLADYGVEKAHQMVADYKNGIN